MFTLCLYTKQRTYTKVNYFLFLEAHYDMYIRLLWNIKEVLRNMRVFVSTWELFNHSFIVVET